MAPHTRRERMRTISCRRHQSRIWIRRAAERRINAVVQMTWRRDRVAAVADESENDAARDDVTGARVREMIHVRVVVPFAAGTEDLHHVTAEMVVADFH